jgi:hypothetical protein
MKSLRFTYKSFPWALLVLCLLSFGLLAPWLGFYWDDWPTIWYLHLFGPGGFKDVFAIDRPLLGYIFMVTTTLLGNSALAWQLFGILTRWASALALWWTLRSLWPDNPRQVTWAVILFTVYPGFTQQPISVTYSNAWIILTAFFLSLGLMIGAVRRPRWKIHLLAGSLLLAAFAMFSTEYFFGLEMLRPVFLWLVMEKESPALPQAERSAVWPRLKRILFHWLPYIGLMIVFLIWRIFLHETPRGQVNIFARLAASPLQTMLQLVQRVFGDVFTSSFLAWGQAFNLPGWLGSNWAEAILIAVLFVVTAILSGLYLSRLADGAPDSGLAPTSPRAWGRQSAGIGLLALFLGGLPFWATDLPMGLAFPWDRFTLAMMLGTSLFITGALELLFHSRMAKLAILALLVGLAAGHHFQTENVYRRDWNVQKDFFWQLTWRAPQLKPGTMVLSSELPFNYFSDNSLTAPLNWTYAPQNHSREMDYLFYDIQSRLGLGLEGFEKGDEIEQPYRATIFTGSTSQSLVLYYAPPGCVKVIDPQIDHRLPQKPDFISEALPLSQPELIEGTRNPGARPPESILGPEPQHSWCYFFEQADLARQQGQWQRVAELGDQAFQQAPQLYPVNAPEYWPFIEGYARSGQWDKAVQLSTQAYQLTTRMSRLLCENWARLAATTPQNDNQQAALDRIRQSLKCQNLQ